MILIVGAGLAGLSTGFHLRGRDYLVVEQEGEIGGVCRTAEVAGFTIDRTGHYLHLKSDYVRGLLDDLLPGQLVSHSRRAAISLQGRLLPYPFQRSFHLLSPEVAEECRRGLEAARAHPPADPPRSFADWIAASFGEGIGRHFMVPYNRKLWRCELGELTCEWVGPYVPPATLNGANGHGANGPGARPVGYNATFCYPREGGIACLPRALAKEVSPLWLRSGLLDVDLPRRIATLTDGTRLCFTHLISTIPLPGLLRRLHGLPRALKEGAGQLRHISVLNVNLGVRRAGITDQHWIYFPDPALPFHRVGIPTNISPALAPPGMTTLSVELAHRPDEPLEEATAVAAVRQGLVRCGLLGEADEVVVTHVARIPCAYVLYDRARAEWLPRLLEALRARGVLSIGRYGAWGYASMEDAILDGRAAAEQLAGRG